MKKYKIQNFVKLLGITLKTAYYYERHNIVSPFIDENNGYRYYCYKDAERIIVSKRLRGMGFSIKDTSHLINDASLNDYEEMFNNKSNELKEELIRKELLLYRIVKFQKEIAMFNKDKEIVNLENEDIYFIPHMKNDGFIENDDTHDDIKLLMDNAEFIFKMKMPEYGWGIGIYKDDAEKLDLNLKTNILVLGGSFMVYLYKNKEVDNEVSIISLDNTTKYLCNKYQKEVIYSIGSFDSFSNKVREKHFMIFMK